MSNEGYHEPIEELTDETRDMHRAITSLMEELEAVDWYNQRMDACKDDELRAILAHNRDEEKEHQALLQALYPNHLFTPIDLYSVFQRKDPYKSHVKNLLFIVDLVII